MASRTVRVSTLLKFVLVVALLGGCVVFLSRNARSLLSTGPRRLMTPGEVTDGYLELTMDLPASFSAVTAEELAPILATVRVRNVWELPIGLVCDPSPTAALYLRFESVSEYDVRDGRARTMRELIFDLGQWLAPEAPGPQVHVLLPGETLEAQVNVGPILSSGFMNWDTFHVRVELCASPGDWTWTWPDSLNNVESWSDRCLASGESKITVIIGNE